MTLMIRIPRPRDPYHQCHLCSFVNPPIFGAGCVHRLFRFKYNPIFFLIYKLVMQSAVKSLRKGKRSFEPGTVGSPEGSGHQTGW